MVLFLFFILLSGCKVEQTATTTTSTMISTTTTTTTPKTEKLAWSNPDFTSKLMTSLGSNFDRVVTIDLADYADFCPNYPKLSTDQRMQFFAQLISIMAKFESGFNPAENYRECSKKECRYSGGCISDATYGFCMKGGPKAEGGIIISRGLLQISFDSGLGYGCKIEKPTDLNDPAKNLECTTKILSRLILQDKRIAGIGPGNWKGGSRYWSVLRGSNDSFKTIQVYTKTLSLCQK